MFTKGQAVTTIGNANYKGAMIIREAFVYSCGKKQMILCDAAGEKFRGMLFNPTIKQGSFYEVHPRLSQEDAETRALEIGKELIAYERARLLQCLERGNGRNDRGYVTAIQRDLDELPGEPTFTWK